MKRRIDISAEEMLRLREEEGLSNAEIAQRLDLHYTTVHKYIGKQPEGIRAPHGSRKKPEDVPEEKPVLLKKLMHIEEFMGEKNKYTVNIDGKTVTVKQLENSGPLDRYPSDTYDKASLERHISELLDILAMI